VKEGKMDEIKSYIPYRGMIEVHGEGQGTYVSWYDYKTLLDQVNRVEELEKGKGYLTRLFNLVSPQCEPFEDLPRLVSQIDNYIAGLNIRLDELEKWKAWAKDVMIDNEAESDGFRNGQAQVQAMLDEVMESNKNLAQDLATLKGQRESCINEIVAARNKFNALKEAVEKFRDKVNMFTNEDLYAVLDSLNLNPKEEVK
jgi:archaellum component FlaC